MHDAMQDADLDNLKYEILDEFEFNLPGQGRSLGGCDLPTDYGTGSVFTTGDLSISKGKERALPSKDQGMSSCEDWDRVNSRKCHLNRCFSSL